MKFDFGLISGIRVTEFDIKPIFCTQFITLKDVFEKIHSQKAMDYILDTYRFTRCDSEEYLATHEPAECWVGIIDFDTDYKIAILENYPDLEKEMIENVGEKWYSHYLRFNH